MTKEIRKETRKHRGAEGSSGRVARRRYRDAERRAAVADIESLGLAEAARTHEVPKSTLHAWSNSPQWGMAAKRPPAADGRPAKAAKGDRSRRFSPAQREHALRLVASGMKRTQIAEVVGTTPESVRRWAKVAKDADAMPQVPVASAADAEVASAGATTKQAMYAPRDPGEGLSEAETAAIIECKQKHPSMGPAQIRAQLKRFKGWRVSIKAIARVLRARGYELVHRGSRPQGPDPIRFEAPRPNAMWQMDFADMRIVGERLHLLVVLDDFSRYCVGYTLADSGSSEVTIEVLRRAIARHGKPESIRSDRGGCFQSAEIKAELEAELIDHIVGRSYHPQGGGKVESLIGTVRRELWDVVEFGDRADAERQLAAFIDGYNERRAHMGIDGLTPADRYFGRGDRVLAAVDALSRRRQGALDQGAPLGGALEETLGSARGAPLEVLRLVICDGVLELRFCGARCVLGPLETLRV